MSAASGHQLARRTASHGRTISRTGRACGGRHQAPQGRVVDGAPDGRNARPPHAPLSKGVEDVSASFERCTEHGDRALQRSARRKRDARTRPRSRSDRTDADERGGSRATARGRGRNGHEPRPRVLSSRGITGISTTRATTWWYSNPTEHAGSARVAQRPLAREESYSRCSRFAWL